MPDDYAADTGTAGTVAVGGSATGEIERGGDEDWFAVTLEAGKWYWIDLEGSRANAGTLIDPHIFGVHDADGNLIRGTDNWGLCCNNHLVFESENAGTYYIAAGTWGNRTGTYRVSVAEIPDDHPAGNGTTGTVVVGGSATGKIERPFDRDWFAVTLEAGKSYRLDLEGSNTNAGTLTDPYIGGVHDANGNLIRGTENDNGGVLCNSRLVFEPEETSTYYIAAGAWKDRTGTYRVSVAEIDDDHPAGRGTTGTIAVGGSATGKIERVGDRDWYAVTLEAGKSYRLDLEGSGTDAGTLTDPYLRGVYDADGNLIRGTDNDNGGTGWNSRLWFDAGTAGTHYVAAAANGYRHGTYLVSVAEVDDDHPGRDRYHRDGRGGRLGHGGKRTPARPGLVRGHARSGEVVLDRPRRLTHERRNTRRPVPPRRLRRGRQPHQRHRQRRRGRRPEQPSLVRTGEFRHLLHRRRRRW